MTGQLLFMAAMGVVLGVCGGYPWGRVLRRRDARAIRREIEQEATEALDLVGMLCQGCDAWPGDPHGDDCPVLDDVPRTTVDGYLVSDGRGDTPTVPGRGGGLPSLAGGPPRPDWREQVAAELAPEALAQNVPEPGSGNWPASDVGGLSDNGGVRLGAVSYQEPGLGHPSPYLGQLTPAQRRRDKHKQRGQYAPVAGWSAPDADMLRETWKPEGAHWLADWQIEWHDSVAQIDEEIADWVVRQRAWLAADRWDRGARRLGAVA